MQDQEQLLAYFLPASWIPAQLGLLEFLVISVTMLARMLRRAVA